MDIVSILFGLVMALFGVWQIVDFFIWEWSGIRTAARIGGFQNKKSLWLFLPTVSFENEKGETVTADPARIDQMTYYFANPKKDDVTWVIYRAGDPARCRIYGYMRFTAGLLLLAPLGVGFGLMIGKTVIVSQVSYAVTLVLIIAGGLAFLKFIQRHY